MALHLGVLFWSAVLFAYFSYFDLRIVYTRSQPRPTPSALQIMLFGDTTHNQMRYGEARDMIVLPCRIWMAILKTLLVIGPISLARIISADMQTIGTAVGIILL